MLGKMMGSLRPPKKGPLPGGYSEGDTVYFTACRYEWSDGRAVHFGMQGEVIGLCTDDDWADPGIRVQFPGNHAGVDVPLVTVDSKPPKALEGGYAVGDVVYFIGFSCDLADGDRLVHGTQGEVIGPSTRTYNDDSGKEFLGICVQFPGNTKSTNINLKLKGGVDRSPPSLLPGGYKLGDKVYYIGETDTTRDGHFIGHGKQGVVMGPADNSRLQPQDSQARINVRGGFYSTGLAVLFPDNARSVNCARDEVQKSPPPQLPGGYAVGDKVRYTGKSFEYPNGDRDVHGNLGTVMGPTAKALDHHGNETMRFLRVAVSFPSHQCWHEFEPSELELVERAEREQVEGGAAGAGELAGGFSVGDSVYWVAPTERLPNGDGFVYADKGEVVGPCTDPDKDIRDRYVCVKFPRNQRIVEGAINQLGRSPPPLLPGGFSVGDNVHYIGEELVFPSGDSLGRGKQGEVLGPSDDPECPDNIAVLFHGNAGSINCARDELISAAPAKTDAPTTSSDVNAPTNTYWNEKAARQLQAVARGRQARQEMDAMGMSVGRTPLATPPPTDLSAGEESLPSRQPRKPLDPSSAEYERVYAYFASRLFPSDRALLQMVAIEKLTVEENQEAYELLLGQMRKREVRRRDKGKEALEPEAVELTWVFHACAAEAIENIIHGGFNRSYAGKNATAYGPGSYFARDSAYSVQSTYSPPDAEGVKSMFMCRLALGAHTEVARGYAAPQPPVRDGQSLRGVGHLVYDVTSDGQLDGNGIPQVMVAYKDHQALADYLVRFRMSRV